MKQITLMIVAFQLFMQILTAGPVPMPMEAYLEEAKSVVVGKMVRIQEDKIQPNHNGDVQGTATINVSRVLRGETIENISFRVYTRVVPAPRARYPDTYNREGLEGIWLINKEGELSSDYGYISLSKLNYIQEKVRGIQERKWSNVVNGLKARAHVIYETCSRKLEKPIIVFGIKNVSDKVIYYPSQFQKGVVSAIVVNAEKKKYEYYSRGFSKKMDNTVYCREINSGETIFLHPYYTCLGLIRKLELPQGKYTVYVKYHNDRPQDDRTKKSWKGTLNAPPIELIIETKEK